MKKFLGLALTVIMILSMVVGCSSKGTKDTTTPEKTPPATDGVKDSENNENSQKNASGDVTIWYYWENEGHQVALNKVIKDYNDSQSDVTVQAKYVPFADFKKQLSIGASADVLPDIVIIDSPDHASYATMGIFAELTDKVDVSNYFDGPIASCTLDGVLYGLPFGSNCLSLYYNTDMLKAASCDVPTTWDELKETAVKLTSGNVTGMAFSSVQNEEGTFNFMPWIWSTGASSFEIGTENGIKALTFVKDLVDSGAMSKEVINWTQGDVMNQFMSGNIAMMINGPWQVATMRKEATGINWDVALIPKDAEYASVLGGENYAVIAGGNEAGALAFLEFATNKDNLTYLMEHFGYIAPRGDVANGQFSDDEIMKRFTAQLEYAKPRGPHAEWPDISDAISLAFNEVITGGSTPEEAGANAQIAIDDIVK